MWIVLHILPPNFACETYKKGDISDMIRAYTNKTDLTSRSDPPKNLS